MSLAEEDATHARGRVRFVIVADSFYNEDRAFNGTGCVDRAELRKIAPSGVAVALKARTGERDCAVAIGSQNDGAAARSVHRSAIWLHGSNDVVTRDDLPSLFVEC